MGSITVFETESEEVVVVVTTPHGTAVCGGTLGGEDVITAVEGVLATYVEAGAAIPVFLFIDQVTATVRHVKFIERKERHV